MLDDAQPGAANLTVLTVGNIGEFIKNSPFFQGFRPDLFAELLGGGAGAGTQRHGADSVRGIPSTDGGKQLQVSSSRYSNSTSSKQWGRAMVSLALCFLLMLQPMYSMFTVLGVGIQK